MQRTFKACFADRGFLLGDPAVQATVAENKLGQSTPQIP